MRNVLMATMLLSPVTLAGPVLAADTCPKNLKPTAYQATYHVKRANGETHQLVLTRLGNTIRYQNSDNIFEQWTQQGEFSRFFVKEQRSVTYTVGDLRSLHRVPNIEQKFHLIAPASLEQLQQQSASAHPCFELTQYNSTQTHQLAVTWMEALQLPHTFSYQSGQQQVQFSLQQISSISAEAFNAKVSKFSDIDFADIGDSESDPFIAKMINQGFIEHGSSGFYHSDGHSMGGSGHSHSH
ncbi:hypothetical protein [Shewanella waksmanii]|uniref:hypothetical protein n=1 Tax=Shewanella waksmanii TaxID=213783 RepID=UPI003736D816